MERQAGAEEHYRRNLEAASQLAMRIEAVERQVADADNGQSRTVSSLSRIDQELQRISSVVLAACRAKRTPSGSATTRRAR